MLIQHWLSVLVAHEGVLHDAVVTWRHHNHLLRAEDDLLVVLTDVRLGTDLHLCDIAVLVQHVEVVVGRDAVDALAFFLPESHLESVPVRAREEQFKKNKKNSWATADHNKGPSFDTLH